MASIKTPTCFSSGVPYSGSFKADSHIECRAHAALLPFPCHAMPLRIFLSHLIYTVLLCLIHTYHAMPMPRPCHALTMPFFSRPRHSTAVGRRPVGYLPTFGFFRLPRGVSRRLLSEAYHSPLTPIHTYDCKEW